jgi:hypothetical protein
MFANLKNLIIAWVAFIAAGYFGIGSLIVGGFAEFMDIYLRPPTGVIVSIGVALVAAGVVYKAAGWVGLFVVPTLMVLAVLLGQIGIIPGHIDNFMNDAVLRVMPEEKTVTAHMSQEELYCEQDRYCKFAPITEESLAIYRRDALLNGNCDRAYDCRPEVNRARVTGALISVQLRNEFPEIRGAYLHAVDIDRQSLSVDVSGPMEEVDAKSLVKKVCASVKGKKYPAVDIEKVSVAYRVMEYGFRTTKTILYRKC